MTDYWVPKVPKVPKVGALMEVYTVDIRFWTTDRFVGKADIKSIKITTSQQAAFGQKPTC